MSTGPLGLQRALFLWGILYNSLGFVITCLRSLLEPTASRSTKLSRLLSTSSDWCVLCDPLLPNITHLSGPLGAFGKGGVSRCFILALPILDSLTLNYIIFNIMLLLLGPAFRFILSSADLRSLYIAILYQGSSAHLDGLIEGNLFIVNETVLPEILLTLLFLLGFIVCNISCVASPVIGVVTLHHFIILGFFHHLYFVNTSLSIPSRVSTSNITKRDSIQSSARIS